jgi:hypothetical protein
VLAYLSLLLMLLLLLPPLLLVLLVLPLLRGPRPQGERNGRYHR